MVPMGSYFLRLIGCSKISNWLRVFLLWINHMILIIIFNYNSFYFLLWFLNIFLTISVFQTQMFSDWSVLIIWWFLIGRFVFFWRIAFFCSHIWLVSCIYWHQIGWYLVIKSFELEILKWIIKLLIYNDMW